MRERRKGQAGVGGDDDDDEVEGGLRGEMPFDIKTVKS